uniref:NHL repeat-containing protein 2 n=1 Tax=Anthurium amnicola TaxID=1678845 RepID=A0A1D1Z7T7_9ARAE
MERVSRVSRVVTAIVVFVLLFGGFPSASAAPPAPARIVSGFVSNALSALLKWLWSLKSTSRKTAISGRSMMKFEGGYTVETVFDGSKLGIEPFAVEVTPSGDLLLLDSLNSNIYRISSPLSRYSRPRLVAGSSEGFAGHIDGRLWEARMNHPKGFTVDDRENIYVADTMNMAIRKISDTGVTTIAGGKWNKGGHVDGPSEDAKFSNDFEVVYIGSSCSLLVVDRGNQAIREIQLHFDDCAYQYGSGFPLGFAVLIAAGFFGYMLALLQRRVGGMVSSKTETRAATQPSIPPSPYQKPLKPSVRPPLIPPDDELEMQDEEGFFTSLGKLVAGASSSVTEIFGVFSGFRRKPPNYEHQNQFQQQRRPNPWPMQESYVIQDDDEPPPSAEVRTPTPRKTYAFMSKDPEKIHHLKQGRAYFSSWEGKLQQQQMHKQRLQQQRHYSLGPQTYYEQSCETTKEIVFGAVQEADSRHTMEIKAVNYGNSIYDPQGLRFRMNCMGYSHG